MICVPLVECSTYFGLSLRGLATPCQGGNPRASAQRRSWPGLQQAPSNCGGGGDFQRVPSVRQTTHETRSSPPHPLSFWFFFTTMPHKLLQRQAENHTAPNNKGPHQILLPFYLVVCALKSSGIVNMHIGIMGHLFWAESW